MLTATVYDTHVEQLFERIRQRHSLLTAAGIPYRIVGGMAVFIHVFECDPVRAGSPLMLTRPLIARTLQPSLRRLKRQAGFFGVPPASTC